MKDKVSIIVPIYKVEAYLDKCVESIVNQTYSNLEIILVDDGSPDNCPKMCDEWAKKDERIRVIHKPNGGLSDARNAGMAVATGEYISFVDSDDFLAEQYVEFQLKAIMDNNVKMSACDFCLFYDGDIVSDRVGLGIISVSSSEDAIGDILNNRKVRAVAWNKMFHRTLLIGEEFPQGKYHEDEFFSYRIIHKAGKIAYIDSKLYYYRQRQGSIMASFNIKHLEVLDAYLERLNLFENEYPELYLKDKTIFCVSCVQFYRTALKADDCDKGEIKSVILENRKKVRFNAKEFMSCSSKQKIYVLMSRFGLSIFSHILNRFEGE